VRVLAALDEHGPSSQARLGRAVGLDRSDVALAVEELHARGAVRRATDPDDRRRRIVELTPAGRALLGTLDAVLDAVQRQLLAPLTEAERDTLVALLGRLQP
jgi:DNA-binding MarR family transcriptional regulator